MLSGNKFILVLVLSDVYKLSGKFEIRFIHCCELKYSSDRNPVLCTESTEPVSGLTWHQNTSNASPSLCKTLVTYIGERSLIQWKSFTKNNSNIGPKHSKTYQGCSSQIWHQADKEIVGQIAKHLVQQVLIGILKKERQWRREIYGGNSRIRGIAGEVVSLEDDVEEVIAPFCTVFCGWFTPQQLKTKEGISKYQ